MLQDFDVWIDGYPRSANSFCLEVFKMANPSTRVRCHKHLPPFIIQAAISGKPGMLLIRKPLDAVSSWSIFWGHTNLLGSLDYYLDFYNSLRSSLPRLFVVTFEEATSKFGDVMNRFNRRFGTRFAAPDFTSETIADCFSRIENAGEVDERKISRPSNERAPMKQALLKQWEKQACLQPKLRQAEDLYREFVPGARRVRHQFSGFTTLRIPTISC